MARPKGSTLTRSAIVNAAIAVLRSDGQSGLGINRVARELGIQPPSMYNHVTGNDDLHRVVALYGWQQFLTYAETALKPTVLKPILTSREQLMAIASSYRHCAKDYPELLTIAASHRMTLEDVEFARLYKGIMQIYTNALTPWGFSESDIIHSARMFNAAYCGYAQLEQNYIFQRSQSLDESHEWMVMRLIDALEQQRSS
ncbi:MAG: TetR/AcrR family transcriptional regulator [Cyanobacteria bacterium]|nr:TetR/AcrR family transcriptional regulator [Cyanobacteriota bacterium]